MIKQAHILLVEDDMADVELMLYALEESGVRKGLSTVHSGEKALEYLEKRGEFSDAQTPSLVLLDVNLPGMSGTELLEKIRSNTDIRYLPVIILTSSADPGLVRQAYALGCNGYLEKPIDMNDFVQAIETLDRFWFETARLPNIKVG